MTCFYFRKHVLCLMCLRVKQYNAKYSQFSFFFFFFLFSHFHKLKLKEWNLNFHFTVERKNVPCVEIFWCITGKNSSRNALPWLSIIFGTSCEVSLTLLIKKPSPKNQTFLEPKPQRERRQRFALVNLK